MRRAWDYANNASGDSRKRHSREGGNPELFGDAVGYDVPIFEVTSDFRHGH